MRFSFVGRPGFNSADSKMPWLREGKTKKGDEYQTLNMYISSDKANRANMELFAMVNDTVKTKDSDGNDIQFDWDDRNDQEIIDKLARYKLFTAKLGDETYRFTTSWDLIEFIKEHKDEVAAGIFRVDGNIQKNIYNGKVSDRFVIQNIYQMDEDAKCQLRINGKFFFNKDSFDTEEWKSEKKLYINGWTFEYVDKETGNKYIPKQLVFDASKIDFENEKHVKLLNYKLKILGLELVDGKLKCKLGKNVYSLDVVINYINGAEQVELTIDMLTDVQKEAVELGFKTLDDFRVGNVYGERVTIYKLIEFNLKGDYADGALDTEQTMKEFEEDIYVIHQEEKVEDVIDNDDEDSIDDEEEEDLFS